MNIEYYIADPTGNITALVTECRQKDIKTVSRKIMENNKNVEQVGYVCFSGDCISLHMSGDEFCGNATMSAAALYCELTKRQEKYETAVSVFGTDTPISVSVTKQQGYYSCECSLEKPKRIEKIRFEVENKTYTFPVVYFDGISHIIADECLSETDAETVIKDIAKRLSVKALGIMLLNEDRTYMKPLVYVPAAETLFYENSCASGSCAVAAVYADKKPISIAQPGGTLRVFNSNKIILSGKVKISNRYSEEL